jgi:DNA (cytosine-5)-methyltransferase 1
MTDCRFTFADSFSGLGGFRIALESFGGHCVFSCDKDRCACLVYKANFGQEPFGDITKIQANDIPVHDVFCAGFPCGPFSLAGKGKGFRDKKDGTLFLEILRIVEYHQPKIVFLENAKNLNSHNGGQTIKIIVYILERAGYTIFYKVLNASNYGVPTSRNRTFIIGFRKDLVVSEHNCSFPEPTNRLVSLKDYIEPFFSGKESEPKYEIQKRNFAHRMVSDSQSGRALQ